MKNKKLKLDVLKVQSFITSIDKLNSKTLNGGDESCLCDLDGCRTDIIPQQPVAPKPHGTEGLCQPGSSNYCWILV